MFSKGLHDGDNTSKNSGTSKDSRFDILLNNEANLISHDGNILIWFDETINTAAREDQYSLSQLRLVIESMIAFTNEARCLQFINKFRYRNKLFLIVSGSLGKTFVPKICHLSQINSIYIFCAQKTNHLNWSKEYKKIKGVFSKIGELCKCLKRDKQKLENDQMNLNLIDSFISKKFPLSYKIDESIDFANSKHDNYHQPKDDIKIDIISSVVPFSIEETSLPIREEEEINDAIHPSDTVAPYMEYKQQMEFSDTGVWPCVSVIDGTRSELVNHLHSAIETVKHFNSMEYFLQHFYGHPIDPHFVIISNPTNIEHLSTFIRPRVERVYIYCSNTCLNEYDAWSERYPNIVSVLQHLHTLTRLIHWDLSACIVNIGNYYDSEHRTDLAQTRYRYAYRLHVIIQGDLNNRIEVIEYTQSANSNN